MEFELNHFDGYFHFFAAANFAWAGSEHFRTAFDNLALRAPKTIKVAIDSKKEETTNKLVLLHGENEEKLQDDPQYKKLIKVYEKFSEKLKLINTQIENRKEPSVELSKSIFLFAGLYTLCILVLAGFQQFFKSKTSVECTLFILHFSSIYILIIFAISCFKDNSMRPVSFLIPIFLLMIFIGLATIHCFNKHIDENNSHSWIDTRINVLIALFISFLPYFLHLSRSYVTRLFYWTKFIGIYLVTQIHLFFLNKIINFTSN